MRTASPVDQPVAVTIAGSDSGGGAGVQADLRTYTAHGVYGTSVVTSVTAQHTRGVSSTHQLPAEEVGAQATAVQTDFELAAGKTGMLATEPILGRVTEAVREATAPFVVDPVMVAASGDRLLTPEAERAYEPLIAASRLVTPNADETAVLTGIDPTEAASQRAAGDTLLEFGADAALVKGGHIESDPVTDLLVVDPDAVAVEADSAGVEADAAAGKADAVDGEADAVAGEADSTGIETRVASGETAPTPVETDAANAVEIDTVQTAGTQPTETAAGNVAWSFTHERIETAATHGSGCTLSSAIAARLARGRPLVSAVAGGIEFLQRAIRYPFDVGQGPGAVNGSAAATNRATRDATREAGERICRRLIEADVSPVVPEVGMNVVAATPYAERVGETAAVEGRITRTLSGVAAGRGVRFGASSHVARFLLAAREFDPAVRFAANCGFDAAVEQAMAALGWHTVEIDRTREPDPDEEGSTMNWAATRAMTQTDETPDAVFDRGAVGKEPMVRLLAADGERLADRLVSLAATVE